MNVLSIFCNLQSCGYGHAVITDNQWRTQDFSMGGIKTSHRDDAKYYVIPRHHDVTSLAVST